MIWLVTANENVCRIYEFDKKANTLKFLEEFNSIASKLKNQELVSDKPGHYRASNWARGAYSPREEPKVNEIDHFALLIANSLDKSRNLNKYDNLIFAVPPKMNGEIHKHLDKHVAGKVIINVKKDYTRFPDQRILDTLNEVLLQHKLNKP